MSLQIIKRRDGEKAEKETTYPKEIPYNDKDVCSTCIHEHEQWGNNDNCKKCKDKKVNNI